MKKPLLIEQVKCNYGKPSHTPAKQVAKEFRLKAARRAKVAFKEHDEILSNNGQMLAHPAPRIYNQKGTGLFYRYQGPNFVRCILRKDGRIDLK